MKAMAQRRFKEGEPLELVELPTPEPRRREVRVRVQAIGVNPVDWKMCSYGPLRWAARLLAPRPMVVGIDFAGVIDAIGPGVTAASVGDRVVGGTNFSRGQRGSYANTVVVREDQICGVPDSVDLAVAAALPVAGVTAWMAVVDHGNIRRAPTTDRRVLVLGASGGVGQLAVQIAKQEGAFVVGVCSARNQELVEGLGADVVLDYTLGDVLDQARPHGPFHIVIDSVGGYSGPGCRGLLSSRGRHIMVASDSLGAAVQVLVPPFRSTAILGLPTRERLEPLMAAIAAGTVAVGIARKLPLAEANEAHRLSRTGRMTGKLVLEP